MKKYFNKALLYNVLLAIAILILLLLIVQWSLKSYTRHGEGIPVPALQGKSFEEAKKLLADNNLEYQIMDSVFDDTKPPLAIVDQNPKAGSKVKTGRTIYITINATSAPTVEVPDLIGRTSLKGAKMQLESLGFKLGEPVYKPDPHLNSVIGVLVNGRPLTKKMRVPKSAIITLVLGDGLGGGRITVPYLIGLTYEEAEFKLKGMSLNVGSKLFEEGVTDSLGAVIYRQEPAFGDGRTIPLGEAIDLFMAKQLPEGIVVDPSLYEISDSLITNQPVQKPE